MTISCWRPSKDGCCFSSIKKEQVYILCFLPLGTFIVSSHWALLLKGSRPKKLAFLVGGEQNIFINEEKNLHFCLICPLKFWVGGGGSRCKANPLPKVSGLNNLIRGGGLKAENVIFSLDSSPY